MSNNASGKEPQPAPDDSMELGAVAEAKKSEKSESMGEGDGGAPSGTVFDVSSLLNPNAKPKEGAGMFAFSESIFGGGRNAFGGKNLEERFGKNWQAGSKDGPGLGSKEGGGAEGSKDNA